MKKKLLIIGGAIIALLAVFAIGTYTGATTDWQTNAINQANSEMAKAANAKADSLTANSTTDIQTTVIEGLSIEEREVELARLLEEYYQLKLAGFTDSPEFAALETRITEIQQAILDRYKLEIDQAFAEQTTP
jgi:hypothetical protein